LETTCRNEIKIAFDNIRAVSHSNISFIETLIRDTPLIEVEINNANAIVTAGLDIERQLQIEAPTSSFDKQHEVMASRFQKNA
jgi:hypothetical protein